jgi:hypothetical protein
MHFNDYRLPIIIYRLVNFELEWIECVEESIGNWYLIVLLHFTSIINDHTTLPIQRRHAMMCCGMLR